MKIIVCMKRVLDTAELKIDPVKHTMIRDGVPSIINPDDKAALEVALQMKDTVPDTTVTVLTMAREDSDVAIREALAMGADHAVLLSDAAFGGADTWATSSTLVAGLKKLEYDLILCGRQSIIGDTAQVGPQIAEKLHLPQVSYVEEIREVTAEKLVVKRQFEDRHHICEVRLPCLLTVLSEIAKPRYMSVSGVVDAYRQPGRVTKWSLEDLKDTIDLTSIGLKGSPTVVKRTAVKEPKGKGEALDGLTPQQAVDAIMERLIQRHLI